MRIQGLAQNILFILILTVTLSSVASTNQATIKDAYVGWCNAIGSSKGDVQKIVKYYAKDAILLPTLSAKILRNDKDGGLENYFIHLESFPNIKCTPKILITQQLGADLAVNSGYYEFSYTEDGKIKRIPARFNFVYKKAGKTWLIINHHSSVLPN